MLECYTHFGLDGLFFFFLPIQSVFSKSPCTYHSVFLTYYFFSYILFQLFWNKAIMHLVMPWFHHCLELTRPMPTSSRESRAFSAREYNCSAEQHCIQLLTLTPTEVSTADPLKQNKKSSNLNLLFWNNSQFF